MFIGGCFLVKANQAKKFEKNDYGVFLNADASSLERFKMYETVVIDAQYFTKRDIELLHQNGTVVYTYLNIGSIENFREYYTTYAIGELFGMQVKYTRTPKFDYLIGSCILDKNGVFHTSGDLSESKLELILERFYKGEPIQQSELPEDETVEADVLSISVPRNMFTDDKLENLQKLIEGKQTLFKHAFRVEQLEVAITENQVSFPWFPLASEPDAVSAYTEFISKLCELAIKLKRVSLKDKEVENEKYAF